jgi:hypothetical protein
VEAAKNVTLHFYENGCRTNSLHFRSGTPEYFETPKRRIFTEDYRNVDWSLIHDLLVECNLNA